MLVLRFKHEGYKVQCPLCEYSTEFKENLKKHIKNKHPNEPSPLNGFQCDKEYNCYLVGLIV